MKQLKLTFLCLFCLISLGLSNAQTSVWDGISSDTSWYIEGKTEYHIKSAAQLKGLSDLTDTSTFEGCIIYLDRDIDLNNKQWLPIGRYNGGNFKGTFNGKGHLIKNLYIDDSNLHFFIESDLGGFTGLIGKDSEFVGLFGYTGTISTICNLNIQGLIDYYGKSKYIGGLVGFGGNVESVKGDITIKIHKRGKNFKMGCIAGLVKNISIAGADGIIVQDEGSFIAGEDWIGGIAGQVSYSADQCHSNVDIKVRRYSGEDASDRPVVGGVVGYLGNISNSIFTGSLNVSFYINSLASNYAAEIGGISGRIGASGQNNISAPSMFYPGPDGGLNWAKSILTPQANFTNSYFLSSMATIVENKGTAVSEIFLKSGNPIDGFSSDIWEFVAGEYPKLKALGNIVSSETENDIIDEYGRIDGVYYALDSQTKTATVVSGEQKYSGDVVILESIKLDGVIYPVIAIGESAFSGCSDLTSVDIPNSVTYIGAQAFFGCSDLNSIAIPNSVTYIGGGAFNDTRWYNNQKDGLIYINNVLYKYKGEIPQDQRIAVKEGTISISPYALSDFITVTIPSSVMEIGTYALGGDNGLNDVYCYTEDIPQAPLDDENSKDIKYYFGEVKNVTLHVPAASIDKYKNDNIWGKFGNIVPLETRTLTYMVNGEVYKTITIGEGKEITAEIEPTKKGYTFSGWGEIPATMPSNDVIVEGSFSINSYTLTYMIDGEVMTSYSLKYGEKINFSVGGPWREGHTFSGWSEVPSYMPANDVVVTGSFTVNKYKLTYVVDGETYKTTEVEYGAPIIAENEPTKDGYTFSGWGELPEKMPANDVTITGLFTKGEYQLTYMVDGKVYKTIRMDYGDAITPEAVPEKEGYTFGGWSEIPATMPTNDVTITGSFTINKYKLIYMVDGDTYKTYEVEYGADITLEEEPTKKGYTFSGWSEVPSYMPANDVTITGSFTFVDTTEDDIIDEYGRIDGVYYALDSQTKTATVISGEHKCTGDVTIKDFIISGGEKYSVTSIGSRAFERCNNLISIIIPNSVTFIGREAFWGCTSLNSIIIPNSVTLIWGDVFQYCNSLVYPIYNSTCFVYLPKSYKGAFTVPNDILTICGGAFLDCTDLSFVEIPNSVTSIGSHAFDGCRSLTSVTIPDGVTSIGAGAFMGCGSLTSVTIPDGVTSISDQAFYNCSSLTSVTIPNSVTYIGYAAFEYCKKMKDVYCYAESVPSMHGYAFLDTNIMNITLHVPNTSIEQYKADAGFGAFGKIVALTDEEIIANGIEDTIADEGKYQIYTLDGTPVETLQQGVNIIRYSDGSTKKVVVK